MRRRSQVPRKRPQRSTQAPQAPRPQRPPRRPPARCWEHRPSPPPLRSPRQQPLSPSRQRLRMPSRKGARSRMTARPHMRPSSHCWKSCRARRGASVNPAGQCAMAASAALRTCAGSWQACSSRAAALRALARRCDRDPQVVDQVLEQLQCQRDGDAAGRDGPAQCLTSKSATRRRWTGRRPSYRRAADKHALA